MYCSYPLCCLQATVVQHWDWGVGGLEWVDVVCLHLPSIRGYWPPYRTVSDGIVWKHGTCECFVTSSIFSFNSICKVQPLILVDKLWANTVYSAGSDSASSLSLLYDNFHAEFWCISTVLNKILLSLIKCKMSVYCLEPNGKAKPMTPGTQMAQKSSRDLRSALQA